MSKRIALLLLLVLAAAALWWSGLPARLSLESLRAGRDAWQARVDQAPLASASLFFALYAVVCGLAIPGATVLTLAAGALFGFWRGLLLVSFASSVGAALAFLLSRYLLRDFLRARFARRFGELERGFARDGTFYLLFLRLVPVFPYFLVNLFCGLTTMPLGRFYLASQIAMLPATALYVNAGLELGHLERLADVLSPRLLLAFALLGAFPLAARKLLARRRRREAA